MARCCHIVCPAESSLPVHGELLKHWTNSANFCLRVIYNPLFPNKKMKLAKTFHSGSSIEMVKLALELTPGQSTLNPVKVRGGWQPEYLVEETSPSLEQALCQATGAWLALCHSSLSCWKQCCCPYSNTCDVRNSKQPWLLHFPHVGKLKRRTGRKDCFSRFPVWGR